MFMCVLGFHIARYITAEPQSFLQSSSCTTVMIMFFVFFRVLEYETTYQLSTLFSVQSEDEFRKKTSKNNNQQHQTRETTKQENKSINEW